MLPEHICDTFIIPRFLRHAHHCKVFAIVVDASAPVVETISSRTSASNGCSGTDNAPHPTYKQLEIIMREIERYGDRKNVKYEPNDVRKEGSMTIVIANKIDIAGAQNNISLLRNRTSLPIFPVSAKSGEGMNQLIQVLHDLLRSIKTPKPHLISTGP